MSKTPKPQVRVLTTGDAAHVEAAVRHLGSTPTENAAEVFLKHDSVVAIGAFLNDEIVGFAYGYVLSRPDDFPMANLYALDVWPEYQRLGLGSKMIDAFRKEVGRVSKLWLVSPETEEASEFYESLGATAEPQETVYELPTIS